MPSDAQLRGVIPMKFNQPLTPAQQALVEQNTVLIHWTIRKYIDIKEGICGLGYDDLYQEGALALCYATMTYQPGGTQFSSFAITVIRNHLLDYCRRIAVRLRNAPTCTLDIAPHEERRSPIRETEIARDDTEQWISTIYVSQLLEHGKRNYRGVAKLGIEAMELKIKGYSGADIARLYHTKPNHVGAWIARAAEKLRQDAVAADLLCTGNFEKSA